MYDTKFENLLASALLLRPLRPSFSLPTGLRPHAQVTLSLSPSKFSSIVVSKPRTPHVRVFSKSIRLLSVCALKHLAGITTAQNTHSWFDSWVLAREIPRPPLHIPCRAPTPIYCWSLFTLNRPLLLSKVETSYSDTLYTLLHMSEEQQQSLIGHSYEAITIPARLNTLPRVPDNQATIPWDRAVRSTYPSHFGVEYSQPTAGPDSPCTGIIPG